MIKILVLPFLLLWLQLGVSQQMISFSVMMQEGTLPPLVTQIAKKGNVTAVMLPPQPGTPQSRLLIDQEKQLITLLVKEGSVKSGYTLPYHMASLLTMMMTKNASSQPMIEQARAVAGDVQFTLSGEKKTVAGKECLGYTSSSQNQSVTIWTTDDMPVTWDEIILPLAGPLQSAGLAGLTKLNGVEGFPMLLEYTGSEGASKRVIRVQDISERDRPDMFDTGGYQIIEMK